MPFDLQVRSLEHIRCNSLRGESCRHILSALYNVAERYDEDAIWSVLRELTPRSARIMWASKTHKVCYAAFVNAYTVIMGGRLSI